MLKCTGCGAKTSGYLEIPNSGIYCEKCASNLAQEGRRQIASDRIFLGSEIVDARLIQLEENPDSSIMKH